MEGLGVNLKFLIIQIANVALFYFLFTRFLLKPILKVLDDRKRKIAEGVENAERAQQELKKIDELKEEVKRHAKTEERKLLDDARLAAQKQADEIIDVAKVKAAKIISDANAAAVTIEKDVMQQVQENELKLIDEIIEKVLGEKLKDTETRAKYQKVMSELRQ
jgi:F-type H+-transporting ATPase subunit b